MKIFIRITISCLIVLLMSCSNYKHYVENEKELKSCKNRCTSVLAQCNKSCFNNCTNCTRISDYNAMQRFQKYKDSQIKQGKIVVLELKSFKDPLQCRKTTCSCKDDFLVCIQSCEGRIHKNLKVVAAC